MRTSFSRHGSGPSRATSSSTICAGGGTAPNCRLRFRGRSAWEFATEELSAREADRLLSILSGWRQEIVRAVSAWRAAASARPCAGSGFREGAHVRGLAPGVRRVGGGIQEQRAMRTDRFHQRTRAGPCGVPQARAAELDLPDRHRGRVWRCMGLPSRWLSASAPTWPFGDSDPALRF